METDSVWALITLLATGAVGLLISLVIIVALSSHKITINLKRFIMLLGFGAFVGWLVTMGNPDSKMSLEAVYKKNFHTRHPSAGS